MKTKNRQSILCLCLAAALLCGCGQRRSAPEAGGPGTDASGAGAAESPTVTEIRQLCPTDEFSLRDSLAMANYLCKNRALTVDDYLYTLEYDEALQPVLGRYRAVDNNLREFTVLVSDCVAEYLTADEGALFYLNRGCLERLDEDGRRSVLCEDACTLQLSGGQLYYLDGEGRLCRMERDGSGQTVLLEERCDRPYVMDGLILAQKGEENALWLIEEESGAEWRLTDGAAYDPLRIGRALYFTQELDGGKRLCRYDFDSGECVEVYAEPLRGTAEFLFREDGWQSRLALAGELLRQRFVPLEGGEAEDCGYGGYHLLDYVGPGFRVDAVYEADGRLNSFLLCAPDGSESRYFGGSVIYDGE